MDFTTAVSIISKDLEEAGILLDQLSNTAVNNMAELRLARSRVRSAAEMVAVLPGLKTEVEVKTEVKAEAKNKVEVNVEVKEVVETKSEVVETKAEVEAEILKAEVVEVKNGPEVKSAPESLKTPESNKSRLADRFSGPDRLVQQVSSVRQDVAITSAMHAMPITDIAAAIGINDKFYFIRELFSGDGKAYVDTIRRLNSAVSLGDAMRILDESTVMGSDPAAQSSFVDVVRRKFNING